jgi:hypothetical protein
MAALGPEPEINLRHFTAGHESWRLFLGQNKHIPCYISDIVSVVTKNASQRRLLDLCHLFWLEHWWVLIPKPMQDTDQLVTAREGRAIAQAVSRRLPTTAARVQTRVWSYGILWWTEVALGQVFSENFGFPSTIIFTITRGWHNRPGVAAVPIASQTK